MMDIKKSNNRHLKNSQTQGYLMCIILCFCSINSMAQLVKKQVKKEDYALWGKLQIQEISNKGNWVSYTMMYDDQKDTLCIQNTQNKKIFEIPKAKQGKFIGEKWYACLLPENSLKLIELKKGKTHFFNETKSFQVINSENHIVMQSNSSEESQNLMVLNLNNLKTKTWNNTTNFKYNPFNQTLAISQFKNNQNELVLVNINKSYTETVLDTSPTETFAALTWQENGQNLVYTKGVKTIGYYNESIKKLVELNLDETPFFSENHNLLSNGSLPITLSKEGNKVFFGFQQNEVESKKENPQIWNTKDRWIYPKNKKAAGWMHLPKIGVWMPEENKTFALTDYNLPKGFLNGNQNYVITYNPMTNEPQFKKEAPLDMYCQKIGTDTKSLLLEEYPFSEFDFHLSPCGQFIFYFKEGNWFSYNFDDEKHRNLTVDLNSSFDLEYYDRPDTHPAYGFAGWTIDNNALLYDKYDVWMISGDGKITKQLTQGRTTGTCFRLQKQYSENQDHNFFNRFEKGVYDLSKDLLLSIEKSTLKGFATWSMAKGIEIWEEQTKRLEQVKKAKQQNRYVYSVEHFNEPPKLIFHDRDKNYKKTVKQSNAHHKNYQWGVVKLITYKNEKGKELKGSLFYPADYNHNKKYPMIVRIYETFSESYDRYVNPTDYNSTGFNSANLTTQGFFVLQPDINYEIGNPGISATDCVLAAVDEAINTAPINKNKIGLIGHSFGGYETLFILTQTNRFATAVASAALSDFNAKYLYIDWTFDAPNYWRFENYQSRMGKSLFEDRAGYERNSPLANVEKINTPLLTWNGLDDLLVNPTQSYSLYAALRRLRKDNVLLLYEGERHSILNKNNQKDLTEKVENWFKHHLQGKEELDWMKPQN